MQKFLNLYYFNYNIRADHKAPLKKAKYFKYLYKADLINFKDLIYEGLYNINKLNSLIY